VPQSKTSSTSKPSKKLTPKQREAARKADAKRYQKDKPKRIAAVKRSQEKDPSFPAKRKARAKINNAVRDGRMEKPAGKNDFHHESYAEGTPKGHWEKQAPHRRRPLAKKSPRPAPKKK